MHQRAEAMLMNAPPDTRFLPMPGGQPVPRAVLDRLLQRTPVNVFLFDTNLVCCYAAPVGDHFLGRPRDDLTGRQAAEILPPAADGLAPVLERAARDAERWQERE